MACMNKILNLITKNLKINIIISISLILFIIIPLISIFICIYFININELIKQQDEAVYATFLQKKNDVNDVINDMLYFSIDLSTNDLYKNIIDEYLENKKSRNYEILRNSLSINLNKSLLNKNFISNICISHGKDIIYQFGKNSIYYENHNLAKDQVNLNLTVLDDNLVIKDYIPQISVVMHKYYPVHGKTIFLRISFDELSFKEIYDYKYYKGVKAFVVDKNNDIISSNENELGEDFEYKNLLDAVSKCKRIKINNDSYLVLKYNVDKFDLKLIYLIPLSTIDNFGILSFTFISIFICIILVFIFYKILSMSIITPINELTAKIQRVGSKNETIVNKLSNINEVTYLSINFSEMILRIDNLIETVYNSEIKKKEAQLKSLESQINPHFLYNTLDSIRWRAIINKDVEVAQQIEVLSNIFRHVLNKGSEITTVKNEVDHIKNYIYIQKFRFGDKIKYEINCNEELLECKTLKLIIQPLVENAIIHGQETKITSGIVKINIYKVDGDIVFEVSDDGIGADEDEINKLIEEEATTKSFALSTTSKRLKVKFGDKYGLEFKSKIGVGTVVKARVPLDFK